MGTYPIPYACPSPSLSTICSQASRNLRLKHTVGVRKRRIGVREVMEGGVREVNKCPGSENMVTDGSFFFPASPGVKVMSNKTCLEFLLNEMQT